MTPFTSGLWVAFQAALVCFLIIRKEHHKARANELQERLRQQAERHAAAVTALTTRLAEAEKRVASDPSRNLFLRYWLANQRPGINNVPIRSIPADEDLERGWWR